MQYIVDIRLADGGRQRLAVKAASETEARAKAGKRGEVLAVQGAFPAPGAAEPPEYDAIEPAHRAPAPGPNDAVQRQLALIATELAGLRADMVDALNRKRWQRSIARGTGVGIVFGAILLIIVGYLVYMFSPFGPIISPVVVPVIPSGR